MAKSFLNPLRGVLDEEAAEDDHLESDDIIAESTNNLSVTGVQFSAGIAVSNLDDISAEVEIMESVTLASE